MFPFFLGWTFGGRGRHVIEESWKLVSPLSGTMFDIPAPDVTHLRIFGWSVEKNFSSFDFMVAIFLILRCWHKTEIVIELNIQYFSRDWQLFFSSLTFPDEQESCFWLHVSELLLFVLWMKSLSYGSRVRQRPFCVTVPIWTISFLCPECELSYYPISSLSAVLLMLPATFIHFSPCPLSPPRSKPLPVSGWLQPPDCSPCFHSCRPMVFSM